MEAGGVMRCLMGNQHQCKHSGQVASSAALGGIDQNWTVQAWLCPPAGVLIASCLTQCAITVGVFPSLLRSFFFCRLFVC